MKSLDLDLGLLWDLAFFFEGNFGLQDSGDKRFIGTSCFLDLAKVQVFSVVSDSHKILALVVLLQFKEEVSGEMRWGDAVQCSNWLASELLGDALGRCQIELSEEGPQVAGMAGDKTQPSGCIILDDAVQFLSQHPKGRRYHCSSKVTTLQECIVVLVDEFEVLIVVGSVARRHGSSKILIGLQGFVQIRHGGDICLGSCEIEEQFHSGELRGLLELENGHSFCYLCLSYLQKFIVVGAVIQDVIQRTDWQGLKSLVQRKGLFSDFSSQILREEGSIGRIEFVRSNSIWNGPSVSQWIQSIEEGEDRILRSWIR